MVTGLKDTHAMAQGWRDSNLISSGSARLHRLIWPVLRPMARILWPPSVEEKASDVTYVDARLSESSGGYRTPKVSDQRYTLLPRPTATVRAVWQ